MNVENNDQNDRLKVDSEVAAKTSEAAIEVQDHHVRAVVEAEDAISITVADETEAIDAAVAAVQIGDQTDVHLKVKPHPKFKEIYQVMLEER